MKKLLAIAMMTGTALTATPASAASVFVGGNGALTGNAFPFGSVGSRYQQVYDASGFSGALSIGGIQFERFARAGGMDLSDGNFTVSVSTTAAMVDALSSTFSDNIGSDNALLFSGTLAPNFDGSFLTLNFSSAFNYDPGAGNLLIDITQSGGSSGLIFFNANSGDAGGAFSRMHDFGNGFEGSGLQTTFLMAGNAVPEPATWAMLIFGFGLIGSAMRRRKTNVKVSYA